MFPTPSPQNMARSIVRRQKVGGAAAVAAKRKSRAAYLRARRAAAPKTDVGPLKRDLVAELLSRDLSFEQIAESLGITVKAARRHLEKIRERLGPQAI